jgi:hypothetical protein
MRRTAVRDPSRVGCQQLAAFRAKQQSDGAMSVRATNLALSRERFAHNGLPLRRVSIGPRAAERGHVPKATDALH